jgi:hypothetical protein
MLASRHWLSYGLILYLPNPHIGNRAPKDYSSGTTHRHRNAQIRKFRNSTRVPWPSNPILPSVRITPGCFFNVSESWMPARSARLITLPFSVTVMRLPSARISYSFHSPAGFNASTLAGIKSYTLPCRCAGFSHPLYFA